MKSTFLIILLLLSTIPVGGQRYNVKLQRLGTQDGLAHNTVRCVVEDNQYNLWIGTEGGLNFYNGFQFEVFNAHNSSFKSDLIKELWKLENGHLIVHTAMEGRLNIAEGLYVMGPDRKLIRQPGFDQNPDPSSLDARQYYQNALYKISSSQLWKYDIPNGTWSADGLPADFQPKMIVDGFVLGQIGNEQAVLHVAQPQRVLDEKDVWALDSAFARVYMLRDEIIHLLGFPDISRAHYDHVQHVIWLRSNFYLMAIDTAGSVIEINHPEDRITFERRTSPLHIGHFGLMFLPTDDGLYFVNVTPDLFNLHPIYLPNIQIGSSSLMSARGMCVVDDELYINIDRYLVKQNLPPNLSSEIVYTSPASKLFALFYDGQKIWTGRQELIRFDPKNDQVEPLLERMPVHNRGLWSFYADVDKWYLGGQSGVQIATAIPVGSDTVPVLCQTADPEAFQVVYQIAKTSQGLYYVTSNGLFDATLDNCNPTAVSFLTADRPASFSHFTHLMEDKDQTFWVTTLDGGTHSFKFQGSAAQIINSLDREDGLPTNTAYAVYPDAFGSVWITTDQGLVQLDKESWSFNLYTTEDGLADSEFNRISHCSDVNGRLYFGGVSGVISFQPADFYNQVVYSYPLRLLHATQFSAWEDTILDVTDEILRSGRVTLHPGDKFIRLEVGLADLFRAGEHRYEYRIPDVYDDWQPLRGNLLSINMLPYGKHHLEIRARNSAGRIAGTPIELLVIARRPFYLQWWFIMSSLAGLIIVVREFWVTRTRRERERAMQLEKEVQSRTETITAQAEELRELQEIRSRFFANISHELRTPLTLIRGPVQSLLGRTQKSEDKNYLELIRHNAESLGERIDDLLLLSRMDAQKVNIQTENFNLNAFLERIMDLLSSGATEKRLHLELINSVDPSVHIRTDRKKLEHIVSNFMSNAIKFTPVDGRVVMKVNIDGKELLVSVEDNGPGIEPENAQKVFDRFYQVKQKGGFHTGTGIGLAICKELAEVLNGSVGLESTPGKGSRFFVRIPFVRVSEVQQDENLQEPDLLVESAAASISAEANARATILIVEDNLAMRVFLQKELSAFQILVSENGQQALDQLNSLQQTSALPDCIISDVMMPVMDGFEMVQTIKQDPLLNAIPVIMLTARAGLEDKLTGLRIGVDDYIPKPFDIRELKARIYNIINRKQAKSETEEEIDLAAPKGVDQLWLEAVEQQVLANISQTDFTMDQLADNLFISRRQMYRRIKQYTGLTANGYVREVRLSEARKICEDRTVSTVAELAYAVGFEDPDYFSRIYFDRFGYRPSERL